MSKSTPYRGEDRILETIRQRHNELIYQNELISNHEYSDQTAWDQACDELHEEFKAEGLFISAEIVLIHKSNH